MTCFSKPLFFKSADTISETIFIQSTWNFAHFFVIKLFNKIRTDFLIFLRWLFNRSHFSTVFFVKNTNCELAQIYEYSIFLESYSYLIRFIHYKQVFFSQQELIQLCFQPRSISSSEALQPSSYIATIF